MWLKKRLNEQIAIIYALWSMRLVETQRIWEIESSTLTWWGLQVGSRSQSLLAFSEDTIKKTCSWDIRAHDPS